MILLPSIFAIPMIAAGPLLQLPKRSRRINILATRIVNSSIEPD